MNHGGFTVMTSPTVKTNTQPVVGANGDIYTAPVGTDPPSLAEWDSVAAPWDKLGMVSEDGVSWTPPEEETSDINIWQSAFPARVVTTGLSSSMTFALDGWDRITVPFALGGGKFEPFDDYVRFIPPAAGESVSKALFVKVLDGPVRLGVYFPKGRVTGRDDTVFKKDEAALLNVTFSLEGSTEYDPYQLIFDPGTFPGTGIAATGATEVVGAAGTWVPANADPAADLAAMTGVTASPLTAWTTGSYMALGDGTKAHWSSTAWVSGVALVAARNGRGE